MLGFGSFIFKYRGRFIYACITSVLNKVLDLMPPILVGWIIDSLRSNPPEFISWFITSNEPWPMAMFLALLAVLIFVFESLFEYMYKLGFMTLAQKVQHDIRMGTYSAIQRREMSFFDDHRIGDSMAMLNDDVNQLERFLNTGFNSFLQLFVLFIFSGYVLMTTSWQLALIGMAPIPLIILCSMLYQRIISPRYKAVRESVGALSSRLENNLGGIQVVKSFTAEDFEFKRVEDESMKYQEANIHAIKLSALYVPLIRIFIVIGFAGVLLIGSYWVLNDQDMLTIGELVLFSMMIQRILWPLTTLGSVFDDYERSGASARRILNILNAKPDIEEIEVSKTDDLREGEIIFENVDFHYKNEVQILNGLSFKIKSKETVGFAGTTGAGKSTIIKLLLRMYDRTGGTIIIDGVDIKDLTLTDLRKHVSLVSQDIYLFYGTIFENIAYSNPEAKIEEVIEAARLAEFHSFVDRLPEKYDTIIGERGLKLSGGQRQRLSIARALIKKAPIIILDEATSSVDTETEKAIQKNLQRITEGRTALVIAHRLSTIRQADRILVIDRGQIVENGSHDELIAGGGRYADLWKIQIGSDEN